jgi:uncharacterized protein YcfJ
MFMSLRRIAHSTLALLLCFVLVLPGCSTLNQQFASDDPNDVCRSERAGLRSTGDYFAQDILAGAAVGAVGGGLIGALAGGNARSAAIGALAGGALGALGGYWKARQQQYSDQASLYRTVYGDIQRDNQSIDRTQVAFNRLVACRRNEAARIRADLRAGRIPRDQAASEMAAVRARGDDDLRLAQSISGHIQERSNDFSYASSQVRSGARSSRGRGGGAATQVQAATSTNLAKRDQFEQSITRAQTNHSSFELS